MKIRAAADASGCHPETIRYYERIGLQPRSGNCDWVYGRADIARSRLADLQRMTTEQERGIASCDGEPRAGCTILSTLRQSASVETTRQ
ncbi:MerR family DNA-binding transcriptional regulator [Xanthomonas cassavae CFBP 4642]|uniref:MerR family DNA-binding transcriptional regulator n=1 Tax=Xanthomonas cassavae CFBP 4642 TaxID=1219375 RepID=A0ABS8HKJ0_9XANT|nr:MerR family DNA-binding transcriptional regulator [Xanthomonas cassavae]MCC4622715.1 MerR family DNA-binding transcriptional regulator [Xanthomonas cassavae CFBP 4642]